MKTLLSMIFAMLLVLAPLYAAAAVIWFGAVYASNERCGTEPPGLV